MSVARVTEIIAASSRSFEDAVDRGVALAFETLENVTWAWIQDQRVTIRDGKVSEYKVVLKVIFVLKQ